MSIDAFITRLRQAIYARPEEKPGPEQGGSPSCGGVNIHYFLDYLANLLFKHVGGHSWKLVEPHLANRSSRSLFVHFAPFCGYSDPLIGVYLRPSAVVLRGCLSSIRG